ncbi:MAG: hypothetical protein NXI24_14935 [bacterium]|nr:hypothetical protein [bacterium]
MANTRFSPEDLERIKAAVAGAEGQTSGEIVPYYVESSDEYEESVWRGGVLASTTALLVFYALRTFTPIWLPFDLTETLFIILLAAGLGSALTYWLPPLRRLLAGRALLNRRTAARALEAFLSEEVFQTRDRTGILIFLSMFEHRVHIIGDSGINARVKPGEWEDIVEIIISGIKSGRPGEGLVLAIERCGDLLNRKEVERRQDDENELADGMRMGQ